jgi:hypothetical protein
MGQVMGLVELSNEHERALAGESRKNVIASEPAWNPHPEERVVSIIASPTGTSGPQWPHTPEFESKNRSALGWP